MVRIGMETVAARLATFDAAHQPVAKGRPSGGKAKPLTWPYERPSPIELAQAGFYYNPTSVSPDNTSCYLCEFGLDGWEEHDDPVAEHLNHSGECGWAITMDIASQSSNPAEIEDPTSSRIYEARRATFCTWPHDGKRGWLCRSDKLAEAGWYFCPSDESEDLVSCAYCNLSLDGWEPKDEPFDEHYRRSRDCSFFVFAAVSENKPTKAGRGKKTRSSKASRASTQSATTFSESRMDVDDDTDQSVLSQSAPRASSKSSKQPKKSKAKGRKTKKQDSVDASSQMDIDSYNGEAELPDDPHTEKARGKKRNSGEVSGSEEIERDELSHEPPPKRRATKTRNVAKNATHSVSEDAEVTDSEAQQSGTEKKRSKTGSKKRSTSKSRKGSSTKGTSKTSSKSRVPKNAEIEAELQAELERDDSDHIEAGEQNHAAQTSKSSEKQRDASIDEELPLEPQKKPQGKKKATTKKASVNAKPKTIPDSILIISSDPDFDMDNSIVPANAPSAKARKAAAAMPRNGTSKRTAKTGPAAKNSTKNEHVEQVEQDSLAHTGVNESTVPMSVGPDSDAGYEDETHQETSVVQTQESPATSRAKESQKDESSKPQDTDRNREKAQTDDLQIHTDAASPQTPAQECTPSPSPQSSNAENRPPSSMQNAPSHSKSQTIRAPFATSTPATSPSKRQARAGQLLTTHPWNPIDLDEVFLGDLDDKGNVNLSGILQAAGGDLTNAEKDMTVEEWILWNAKNGEEKLKNECERLVGIFEQEGGRAMRALEGIECTE